MKPKVVITDNGAGFSDHARTILAQAGMELIDAERQEGMEPQAVMQEADALLVIWYPITAEVLDQLPNCKVIVRCGIGVDNVDLEAARERGILVCNVPDYCINEVADHTLALALTLARQLPTLDKALRAKTWKPDLPTPIYAFEEMTFATIGFGRIAQAVLERARAFRFRLAAYDPYVGETDMMTAGVAKITLDQVFKDADILSLHSPLTAETRHMVNAVSLGRMKRSAILINTSRGPLVDTLALAEALQNRTIAAAGVDVFETEPLPDDHPLRECANAFLTPHFAWHSAQSGPKLHRMAAEEVVRALRKEPVRSCVNFNGAQPYALVTSR